MFKGVEWPFGRGNGFDVEPLEQGAGPKGALWQARINLRIDPVCSVGILSCFNAKHVA